MFKSLISFFFGWIPGFHFYKVPKAPKDPEFEEQHDERVDKIRLKVAMRHDI